MNSMNCGSMKLFTLGTVLLLSGFSHVRAGGVTLTTHGGSQFTLKDGAALPQGCAIRIGSFNLPDATRDQTLAATKEYATLKSWFKPLAEGAATTGAAAQPGGAGSPLRANGFPNAGEIFGTITDISSGYMTPGARLYVWVFNHANPAHATQWGIFTATNWLAPQSLGNQVLSTSASVTPVQGGLGSQQLQLRDIPATYGNWTWQSYPGGTAAPALDASADPDGDGLANIAEYAWRLNPATTDQTRTTLSGTPGSNVVFRFQRPRNTPDVAVTAECSPDLKTWTPAASTVVSSDADFDTCECTPPVGTRFFWRVRFAAVP